MLVGFPVAQTTIFFHLKGYLHSQVCISSCLLPNLPYFQLLVALVLSLSGHMVHIDFKPDSNHVHEDLILLRDQIRSPSTPHSFQP